MGLTVTSMWSEEQIASQREGEAQGHGEWREGEQTGGLQKSAQEGTGTAVFSVKFS